MIQRNGITISKRLNGPDFFNSDPTHFHNPTRSATPFWTILGFNYGKETVSKSKGCSRFAALTSISCGFCSTSSLESDLLFEPLQWRYDRIEIFFFVIVYPIFVVDLSVVLSLLDCACRLNGCSRMKPPKRKETVQEWYDFTFCCGFYGFVSEKGRILPLIFCANVVK